MEVHESAKKQKKKKHDELLNGSQSKKNKSRHSDLDTTVDESILQSPTKRKKTKKTDDKSIPSSSISVHEEDEIPRKKKKNKRHPIDDTTILEDPINELTKIKKKKKKKSHEESIPNELIPREDLHILLERIEAMIPMKDKSKFTTRLTKMDWSMIQFKNYSIEQCQSTWSNIQKNLRGYRLLKEMIDDAKVFVENPNAQSSDRIPKKPITLYSMYCKQTYAQVKQEDPNLSFSEISRVLATRFKELSAEELQELKDLVVQRREQYDVELAEFFERNPSSVAPIKNTKGKKSKGIQSHKPFELYLKHLTARATEKKDNVPDKTIMRSRAKLKWASMSKRKKLVWITSALELEKKYVEEMLENDPDFDISKRYVISKEEQHILDESKGKPEKPPSSAYSLFSTNLMRESGLPALDRMKYVAEKWKSVNDEEKANLKKHVDQLTAEYKIKYAEYIEKYPDEAIKVTRLTADTKPSTSTKKKNQNDLIFGIATPGNWNEMTEVQKEIYKTYVNRFKHYFDNVVVKENEEFDNENEAFKEVDDESD